MNKKSKQIDALESLILSLQEFIDELQEDK